MEWALTVAIGLVCSDGVLVASDSMGSSGKTAQSRIKVHASEVSPTIWTYSGSQYTQQCIERAIEESAKAGNDHHPDSVIPEVRESLRQAYDNLVCPPGTEERELAAHAPDILILGWHDGQPSFRRLSGDLASLDCDNERLVAVGSGRDYAAVVRASLAHYLDRPVGLHLGKVLAHRVIRIVCDVSSYNVAPPIQIAIADASGARVLSTLEIAEVADLQDRWVAVESGTLERAGDAGLKEVANDLPSMRPGDRIGPSGANQAS